MYDYPPEDPELEEYRYRHSFRGITKYFACGILVLILVTIASCLFPN